MRSLFTIILLLLCFGATAQDNCTFWFNFDANDTLYNQYVFIDTANHNNTWQVGKPSKTLFNSAFTLPNAIVTDTLNPYPANDSSVFVVKVPDRKLVDAATMTYAPIYSLYFTYKLDKSLGDSADVDISLDSGQTWQSLRPKMHPSANLTQSTAAWVTANASGLPHLLNSFTSLVYFRFTFRSGATVSGKEGWIIDDLSINYWCESAVHDAGKSRLTIYPNPSDGNIAISNEINTQGIMHIYTLDGRRVYTEEVKNGNIRLPLPPGVYLLKYTSVELHTTEKIIIR